MQKNAGCLRKIVSMATLCLSFQLQRAMITPVSDICTNADCPLHKVLRELVRVISFQSRGGEYSIYMVRPVMPATRCEWSLVSERTAKVYKCGIPSVLAITG